MTKKALIIDSDQEFLNTLEIELKKMDFQLESAATGRVAVDLFKNHIFDLIIMDFNLQDMDGLILCREFRRNSSVPIIVVTENDTAIDKILGLDSGADDYLVKPFNVLELVSRIKALFRRIELSKQDKDDGIIKLGEFTLNKIGRTIELNDNRINLTGKEFDIFYVLISNPGEIFSREELLELVWEDDYYGDGRTIDVHIRRIRRKLGRVNRHKEYILTKWGEGYYFSTIS